MSPKKPSSRDRNKAKGLQGRELMFSPEVWGVIEFLANRREMNPASMMKGWIVDRLESEGHLSKAPRTKAVTQKVVPISNENEWEDGL